MTNIVKIPLTNADDYLIKTFDQDRYLRSFNRNLRGVVVPVGDFHEPLHDQVLYDINPDSRSDVSHLANLFSVREPRYKATVKSIEWCNEEQAYIANVEWSDLSNPPRQLRVTAVVKGRRCIRVLQFGIE